jgi:hypothetical protein
MKLISLADEKIDLDNMTPEEKEAYRNKPVELIAVLSRNQYQMIRTGAAEIEIPYGVEMQNKAGTRTLSFSCEDRDIAEDLIEGLDNSGIAWEEDNSQDINITDIINE